MQFTVKVSYTSASFVKDKAHRALVMGGSRCTRFSDFTAAHVDKVHLAKSIKETLFGTSTMKFFYIPQAATLVHPVRVVKSQRSRRIPNSKPGVGTSIASGRSITARRRRQLGAHCRHSIREAAGPIPDIEISCLIGRDAVNFLASFPAVATGTSAGRPLEESPATRHGYLARECARD